MVGRFNSEQSINSALSDKVPSHLSWKPALLILPDSAQLAAASPMSSAAPVTNVTFAWEKLSINSAFPDRD